jgi:hemerythrin
MLIPDHPCNDGTKPTLIGSKDQVDIQMKYIHLGNYGLSSVAELRKSGISDDLLTEIMDIKLKFAFGKFKESDELLNKIYLESEKIEIKDALFIRRISVNLFEFSFEDETIVVDLNMPKGQFYIPPYHLAHTHFDREYFSVIHTGEGDGWDIRRPCMSSIITYQGKIYLIDAGPNINKSLNALGISVNEISGIFHTHSHDDHFAGITTLIQNDHRIKYFASSVVKESVFKKLSVLLSIEQDKLDNFFDFQALELDVWNNINGLEVKPILSPHPVETNIFYFRTLGANDYKSYGHLADICSFDVLDTMLFPDDQSQRVKAIKEAYLTPVTLKKIDNGVAAIHGNGLDFADDQSERLILSHSSKPLTPQLKQIGSGASFGSVDVLIPAEKDYDYKSANILLKQYFPEVSQYWISLLLNNEIQIFNSESIIIKDKRVSQYVYLILTGNVEMIQTKEGIYNTLSSGAIIGDFSAINQIPSNRTFRASSYVRTLAIPHVQYYNFVKRNMLYDAIQNLHEQRGFLEDTHLFGESISYSNLNLIASNLHHKSYKQGEKIESVDGYNLQLIQSGHISIQIDNQEVMNLEAGDFFGESHILNIDHIVCEAYALTSCEVKIVKDETIKGIPIVFWKLYTSHEERIKKYDVMK